MSVSNDMKEFPTSSLNNKLSNKSSVLFRQSDSFGLYHLFHPYYFINFLTLLSYYPLRQYYLDTTRLKREDSWGFEREVQIFSILSMTLITQYYRSNSAPEFLRRAIMFGKVAILCCIYTCEYRATGWYLCIYLVELIILTPPTPKQSSLIQELNAAEFEDMVEKSSDSQIEYLVHFYATWASTSFGVVFSKLADRFTTNKLKFVKVNIGAYAVLAKKYDINISAFNNKDLPTIILFRGGQPLANHRLPLKENGKVTKKPVLFEANMIKFFDLERRMLHSHTLTKSNAKKKNKSKK